MNVLVLGKLFDLAVVIPTSHIGVPRLNPSSVPDFRCLLLQTLEGAVEGWSSWVPAPHVGDLGGVPVSSFGLGQPWCGQCLKDELIDIPPLSFLLCIFLTVSFSLFLVCLSLSLHLKKKNSNQKIEA